MSDRGIKVENYQRFWGDKDQVLEQMEKCPKCGAKFVMTHLADHENLYIHEEVKCPDCDYGTEENLFILN